VQTEQKPDFVTRVVNFLADWNRLMRSIESVLIDLIAATAPWLAPLLPAYMVHTGLTEALKMNPFIAWTGAVVVEFLGLSAVSTTLTLWDYNDRKREASRAPKPARGKRKKTARKVRGLAPVWIALAAGLFYMTVVLVVNVVLDKSGAIERLAKALLSSLSIIAALILAVRAQHARRLEAAESRRNLLKQARQSRKDAGKLSETSQNLQKVSETFPKDWRKLSNTHKLELSEMTVPEIAAAANVTERTAITWSGKLKSNGFHE